MSRCIMEAACGVIAVAFSAVEAQNPGGFRWSVATGPTMAIIGTGLVCGNQFNCTRDNAVTGAAHGRHHLGVGVSRPIGRTALVFRADALYNVSVSSANSWTMLPPGFAARNALRDEWYSLGLGLQWDAMPRKLWSPYLLTSAGLAFNRLGWNDIDVMSTTINRSEDHEAGRERFPYLIPAEVRGRSGVPSTGSVRRWRGHVSSSVFPS